MITKEAEHVAHEWEAGAAWSKAIRATSLFWFVFLTMKKMNNA